MESMGVLQNTSGGSGKPQTAGFEVHVSTYQGNPFWNYPGVLRADSHRIMLL